MEEVHNVGAFEPSPVWGHGAGGPPRDVRHRAGPAVSGSPPRRVAPGRAVPRPLRQAAAGEGGEYSTPGGGGYQGQTALRGGPAFSPGEVCVHEDYSELPSSCSFI